MIDAYVLLFIGIGLPALFITGVIVYIWFIPEKWLRILPTRTERVEKNNKIQLYVRCRGLFKGHNRILLIREIGTT